MAAFDFDPSGRVCLDVGASTGGFTQVLVEGGATKVYAVDVGHGQLHPTFMAHQRVVSLEGTDARSLDATLIPDSITAIVSDVSFISVRKALPAALALAAPGCWLVVLVKPQFEVGRARVGKGGIVRDEVAQHAAVADIARWLQLGGWHLQQEPHGDKRASPSLVSPIVGGSGNREFLLGATRDV